MTRRTQLLIIAMAVLVITSAVSHLAALRIGFRTQAVTPLMFGATNLPVGSIAAGSSLAFFGIAWPEIAQKLGARVQGWAVPSGSVFEMEVLQRQAPSAGCTFLGIGVSDLNEDYVSDFRAQIVSLPETVKRLCEARVSWPFARRVLSQYPLKFVRVLYPTAGRSAHVMVGIREELRSLRRRPAAAEEAGRAVLSSDANTHQDSISTWPEARRLRNLADLREHASGGFEFHGVKRDALFRFLDRGARQGKVVVVVIPESPAYKQEFVTPEVRHRFDALLAEARTLFPVAVWVRLDTVSQLQSNDYYWDLVHMNAPGQAIATRVLLAQLAAAGIAR